MGILGCAKQRFVWHRQVESGLSWEAKTSPIITQAGLRKKQAKPNWTFSLLVESSALQPKEKLPAAL